MAHLAPIDPVLAAIIASNHSREHIADYIRTFVAEYQGPPLVICATGGGVSMADIAKVPGSSRVLHTVYIPYATDSSQHFIARPRPWGDTKDGYKAVCAATAEHLHCELSSHWRTRELAFVTCTAALATNRHRRGDDHAYIVTQHGTYHAVFPKESLEAYEEIVTRGLLEEWRLLQDFSLARACLNMLLYNGDPGQWSAFDGSIIERLHA